MFLKGLTRRRKPQPLYIDQLHNTYKNAVMDDVLTTFSDFKNTIKDVKDPSDPLLTHWLKVELRHDILSDYQPNNKKLPAPRDPLKWTHKWKRTLHRLTRRTQRMFYVRRLLKPQRLFTDYLSDPKYTQILEKFKKFKTSLQTIFTNQSADNFLKTRLRKWIRKELYHDIVSPSKVISLPKTSSSSSSSSSLPDAPSLSLETATSSTEAPYLPDATTSAYSISTNGEQIIFTNGNTDFIVKKVSGDGSCFFYAVYDQLLDRFQDLFSDIIYSAEDLRAKVVDHMDNNWHKYRLFFLDDVRKDDFLKEQSLPETYADNQLIQATANMLNIFIQIHKIRSISHKVGECVLNNIRPNPEFVSHTLRNPPRIHLLYTGDIHYDSLVSPSPLTPTLQGGKRNRKKTRKHRRIKYS